MTFTKYFQIVACLATLAVGAANLPGAEIVLTRVPDGGLQPQALSAPDGTTHLVYLKGNPQAVDLFYVRKALEASTKPIRVNSRPGAAVAMGTIRGAQVALGKAGRVHVAWNGAGKAVGHQGAPMLYARLDDEGLA